MAMSRSVVPLTTLSMGVLGLLLLIGSVLNSRHIPVVQSELLIPHSRTHTLRVGPKPKPVSPRKARPTGFETPLISSQVRGDL